MLNVPTDSHENLHDVFLGELHKKIRPLPIKSSSGHKCICIDMQNCSTDFVMCTEEFIKANDKHFKLHVKGKMYYIEVVDPRGIEGLYFTPKGTHRPTA